MFRLVFVDDESWALNGLRRIIDWNSYGFEISACCSNSNDAIDAIIRCRPHAVFTDIRMPGMSGIDFIAKMKAVRGELTFIINSAYSDFDVAKKAILYNVYHYLLKPLDADEVAGVAKRLFTKLSTEQFDKDNGIDLSNPTAANRVILESIAIYHNCYLALSAKECTGEILNGAISVSSGSRYYSWLLSVPNELNPKQDALFFSRRHVNFNNLDEMHEDALIALECGFQYSRHDTVGTVQRYLGKVFKSKITLSMLASKFFLNEVYLCQLFKKNLGITIFSFLRQIRIYNACRMLRQTDMNLQEVALESGYTDYSYFTKHFKKIVGTTPEVYRRQEISK